MIFLLFDRTTKEVIGKNMFWEQSWTNYAEHWFSYDFAKHKAIVLDKDIPLFDADANTVLQPVNWNIEKDNSTEYLDHDDVFPPAE